jgi:hypothetical protein
MAARFQGRTALCVLTLAHLIYGGFAVHENTRDKAACELVRERRTPSRLSLSKRSSRPSGSEFGVYPSDIPRKASGCCA